MLSFISGFFKFLLSVILFIPKVIFVYIPVFMLKLLGEMIKSFVGKTMATLEVAANGRPMHGIVEPSEIPRRSPDDSSSDRRAKESAYTSIKACQLHISELERQHSYGAISDAEYAESIQSALRHRIQAEARFNELCDICDQMHSTQRAMSHADSAEKINELSRTYSELAARKAALVGEDGPRSGNQ